LTRAACAALVGLVFVTNASYAVTPGVAVGKAEFPATGALIVFDEKGPRLTCTGTLIAPDVVLTAGHCMFFLGRRLPAFVLGPRVAAATPAATEPVSRVVIHPQFVVRAESGAALHDLALVLLARPVPGVTPEKLLSKVESAASATGAAVDLVGYGRMTHPTPVDGIKNRGRSKLVATRPFEWVIGARSQPQNCDGDSGGPAFVKIAGKRRLIGIASRSVDDKAPCVSGTVHARPDAELDWIMATLRSFRESRR
jgi:secreted trypsin-like serine protease